ncbi:dUTPase [bacterium]|jgi:dimeric dUTPase (all-alpha-NTP-PPase superfamily)|nr:dUTPase [bacterium]
MEFSDLYSLQEGLDREIHQKHETNYRKTMSRRILAFIIELGEFANETRCFKYWSLKGPSKKECILEEYVDALHFLLSLGLAIGYERSTSFKVEVTTKDLSEAILGCYEQALYFKNNISFSAYRKLFESFLAIALLLDFKEEEIKSAYYQKNQVNHQRQAENY